MTAPELLTPRLRLRMPRKDDFATVAAFMASERAQFIGGARDAQAAWKSFCSVTATWALDGYGYWSVERRDDAALVGAVGFLGPPQFPEIELGWDLYDGHEGRGYATEAAAAARAWGYRAAAFATMVSYVEPANGPSIRVAERLGCARDANATCPYPEDIIFRHPAPEAAP